jgi:hypothetical protein
VHQVEVAGGQSAVPGIAPDHFHVGQPGLAHGRRGHHHVRRVGIQAHHPAARPGRGGQQAEDAARAAAKVDGGAPGPQADPGQQRLGLRPQFVGLAPQPGGLLLVGTQRVGLRRVQPSPAGCGRPAAGRHIHARPRDYGHDGLLIWSATSVPALDSGRPTADLRLTYDGCLALEPSCRRETKWSSASLVPLR